MRLGQYPCKVSPTTKTHAAYKAELIHERHRHRYEVNNDLREELVNHGLIIGGTLPNGRLVEIIELSQEVHPWFVGVQFHPELKSRPTNPHPLFREFIAAAIK
jgi:CTP synthase